MSQMINMNDILQADVLPCLPAIAIKILTLKTDASADDMARIISQDASLTARIIKAANAPLFAPPSPVTNVKRAIAILGNRHVLALTLTVSLTPPKSGLLDFSRFWESSLSTAIASRRILEMTDSWISEEGYTAGLLANLGIILLANAMPVKYREVLETSQQTDIPIREIEKNVFGFNYTELGAAAGKRWNFPASFLDVMQYHHDPQGFTGDKTTEKLIRATHLGEIVTDLFTTGQYKQLNSNFLSFIDTVPELHDLSFEDLAREVAEELKQTSNWMGVNLACDWSVEDILKESNKRLVSICLENERAVEWFYRNQLERIQSINPFKQDKAPLH